MADTKISALAAVASVTGADEFAVNEAGTSKKATATQVQTFAVPMTTRGDILIENATPTPARLAIGASATFLRSNGTDPAWAAIGGADLPNPSATTLGGIESLAAVASKWINTISTAGVPSATQPAFTDISGTATKGQLPATTVSTDQTNVYTSGLQDFTSVTMEIPEAAGFAAGVDSTIGLDTTNKNVHIFANAADAIVGAFASAPTTGDVVSATVSSSNVLLSDAGFLATNVVRKDAANTGGASMTLNMVASTGENSLIMPSIANAAPTTNAAIEFDSTALMHVAALNGKTAFMRPLGPSNFAVMDEFMTYGAGGANITGELQWTNFVIGGAGTTAQIVGVYPNIGIVQVTTSATSTQGVLFRSAKSSTDVGAAPLQGNAGWETQWIFQLSSAANVRFRIGFELGTQGGVVEPTDGIWLRFDTNAAYSDANFQFVCRAASTNTATSSAIAGDALFHRVRIRSTAAGTVEFTLYSASGAVQAGPTNISTNVPTGAMSPCVIIVTDTSATKAVNLDYFHFFWTGLAR